MASVSGPIAALDPPVETPTASYHPGVNRLFTRSSAVVALFSLTFLTLPVAVASGWRPTSSAMPVWWLAALLAVSLGAPFFMLSTGAPLLQRWFSESGHPSAANPYFLYAASNLGSMVALLAYPVLIEPTLRLEQQSHLWTAGYVVLAALIATCAFVVRRRLLRGSPASSGVMPRAVSADAIATDLDALG